MGQASCCSAKTQRTKQGELTQAKQPQVIQIGKQANAQPQTGNEKSGDNQIVSLQEIQKISNQGTDIRKDHASGSANSKEILDNYLEAIKQSSLHHSGKSIQKPVTNNKPINFDDDSQDEDENNDENLDELPKPNNNPYRLSGTKKPKKTESKRQSNHNPGAIIEHHTKIAPKIAQDEFRAEKQVLEPNDIPILKVDAIEEDNEGDGIIEDENEDIFAQGDAIIEQCNNQIQKTASQKKKNHNPYYNNKVRSSFKEDEEIATTNLGQTTQAGQPKIDEFIEDVKLKERDEEEEEEGESESCYSEFAEEKIFKENQNASLKLYQSSGQLMNTSLKIPETKPRVQSTYISESKRKSLMRASAGRLNSVPKIPLRQSQIKESLNVLPSRQSIPSESIRIQSIEIRVPVQDL